MKEKNNKDALQYFTSFQQATHKSESTRPGEGNETIKVANVDSAILSFTLLYIIPIRTYSSLPVDTLYSAP